MSWVRDSSERRRVGRTVQLLGILLFAFALPMAALGFGAGPLESSYKAFHPDFAVASANSTGGDPPESANSGGLCPSSGPVILGIEWNCVAILNLTELLLIFASIGIVAYVFWDSRRAELPGEAREVPVTPEEWTEYRKDREIGIPYSPPETDAEGDHP